MKEFEDLSKLIVSFYENGVTIANAELHAARFLHAQLQVSSKLKYADLNSRMRKSGLKAIKAAVYLAEVHKADKKPSDVLLNAIVDADELVSGEQTRLDEAEVERDELERLYDIFLNAHIYLRGIAKGNFGG